MAYTVGEIVLNLVINQNQYQQQLKGITGIAKKAGAALVAAFSIKKIAEFGEECLKLGSDLQEVQNVVDVTFPNMAAQVDGFAKNAATSFGLSETMAKKFTGTFGAMAKAFGFSEQEAYQMGSTLTGLAGDVASFYNISQDEAYTKLKSVFTGETETLKDLGVVMTQNALDAYAMANGYGKTTQAMSEAEKVALRYAFVQDQLSAASGDFARTSDSWANQVRILSLQFDSLKATIGQGLINLFTPVIKVINTVIGKLSVLAGVFKSFTELVTGKKAKAGVTEVTDTATEGFSSASGAADNLSNSTSGAGKAAKKAAKEMRTLMGFDQIQKMDVTDSDESSSGSSGGFAGSGSEGMVDFGTLPEGDTVVDKMDQSVNGLIKRVKELAGLFKKGFLISFGDSEKNIHQIKSSLRSIQKTLKEVFTSGEVVDASRVWVDTVSLNLGKEIGAVAKIAVAIATNLTSGIAQSLEEKKEFIKSKLVSILTLSAESWNVNGNFATALGDIISSAFTDHSAINIASDICSIFITGVLEGAELFVKAGLDLTKFIAQPIIDNKSKIETAITNTLKPVSENVNTLKTQVEDAFKIIGKVYDKHVHPMFAKLTKGFSDSLGKFLDVYNKYIVPVWNELSKEFRNLYTKHIKPYMKQIGALIGDIADHISDLYEKRIKPVVDWCIETIIPILAPVIEAIGKVVLRVIGIITDLMSGFIEILRGITTFLTGVFTGDWSKAWEGIKLIFSGAVNAIKGIWSGLTSIFRIVLEAIKAIFSPIGKWFKKKFQEAVKSIHGVFSGIGQWFGNRVTEIKEKFMNFPEWFKKKFQSTYTNVQNAFSKIGTWFGSRATSVKNKFTNFPEWFKNRFQSAYTKIKNVFSGIGTWFGNKATSVKNKFMNFPEWFKNRFQSAYTNVKNAFSGIGSFFDGVRNTVSSKFSSIGTAVGDAIGGSFKSVMNGVLSTVENAVNKGISFINGAISKINMLPGVKIPHIDKVWLPRLAQGGYVKKNTPQLAMIGDNRHQGEVVAPEDKLLEMASKAAQMSGGGIYDAEILKTLKEILTLLKELDLDIVVDGKKLKDVIVKRINQQTRATGVCEIII